MALRADDVDPFFFAVPNPHIDTLWRQRGLSSHGLQTEGLDCCVFEFSRINIDHLFILYFYQIGAAMLFDWINGGVPTHDYNGFTVCGKNKVSFDFEYQDICGFLCYIYMPSVLSVKKLL